MNLLLGIFFTLLVSSTLFAFVDDDFDGVEDAQDRCLDTPFMDLVDSSGCPIASLVSEHKFDVIAGVAYSQKDETTLDDEQMLYTTLQFDYNFKNFSLYTIVSRYQSDYSSGLDDTLIGIHYTFNLSDNLNFSSGITLFLPTYDSGLSNEQSDIATNFELSYYYESFFFLALYGYTFINDTDTIDLQYQNTSSYQLGIGYMLNTKVYLDAGVYKSASIYKGIDDIENILFNLNFYRDDTYFVLLNYSHGLSDSASDNYFSLKFGRNF